MTWEAANKKYQDVTHFGSRYLATEVIDIIVKGLQHFKKAHPNDNKPCFQIPLYGSEVELVAHIDEVSSHLPKEVKFLEINDKKVIPIRNEQMAVIGHLCYLTLR